MQLGLLDDTDSFGAGSAGNGLTVRESRRARHLILQVVPPRTLEVVVPRGTRPKDVESFILENRDWIERAKRELAFEPLGKRKKYPTTIRLAAIDETVRVRYEHDPLDRPSWRCLGHELTLFCRESGFGDAKELLRSWLLARGREYLKPWLAQEALRFGKRPRKVHVRLQRTRWGSCSWQGTISLNASLLLVEPELVRYLMVHELCHLRWLDHSRRYWRLVERFEPDYEALDARLTEAWARLPFWLEPTRRRV